MKLRLKLSSLFGAIATAIIICLPLSALATVTMNTSPNADTSSVAHESPSVNKLAASLTWSPCASERAVCTFSGTKRVRFGEGTNWVEGVYTDSVNCNVSTFGGDPAVGTRKSCETQDIQWQACAAEQQTCNFTGRKLVRYGAGDNWVVREARNTVECNNATFGDPLPRTRKSCETAPLKSDPASAADTQAPTPPSGLTIADLTCQSVTLSWNPSTDNVGVAFYDIYHDGQQLVTVNGGKFTTPVPLTPGANWNLYVNARDAAGNVSQASTTLPITVPQCISDTQPPTVPTGLAGSVAGTTITLRWNASTDNVGVTAYDIYRNAVKVGSTPNLAFTDPGLAANTSYSYAVAARDNQSNTSQRSASKTLTTGSSCNSAVCSVAQVVQETDIPWGLITLPDGDIIYSRRDALDLVRLDPTTSKVTNLGEVPNSERTRAEGGLLGLAVTPGFPSQDQWIYIYHTSPTDNRIVRIKYVNGALVTSSLQVLLSGIARNIFHNGGRLRFGPDGKLYATTGDAQNAAFAQNKNSLNGKVLRLNPDGSVPSDNPFGNYVWSYGHRNPQGLAFDSEGRLWEQEFGEKKQDETNLIVKGGNYGWPDCEGTVDKEGSCQTPGFIAPKFTYTVLDGSCSGIAIVRDVMYVACLQGKRIYRHVISGNKLTSTQELFSGTYGRLRTLEPTIDGGLWMTTSNSPFVDDKPNNSNEKIFKINLGD
jgi:glucose/arabinose dehydrogenase